MIDEKFLIKKIQEKIRNNSKFFKFLETELEKEECKKNPDENFIFNTMQMMARAEVTIAVYKDVIKIIKNKEFDNNDLIN
ncbi:MULTISPECIES: hypothetical protein [unclassified Spiroplasma]|uniref:hypothetical protein n=1 Tax=unclassified Spiroplasma TaxID=2637901 RepID=UPI0030CE7FE0